MTELMTNPNETATLINVAVSLLGANPYRDMKTFPIQASKVASLKESIQKTGFWPSIIARPIDNMIDGKVITQDELNAMIASGYDFSNVEWEKAFAHHRQAACEDLGFATIPIIPQILTNDNMLLMMALENKGGFGSNINSQLETVRQVGGSIDENLEQYDDYEAYTEDNPKKSERLFTSKQSFTQAKENGAGYRIVRKFLGETWTEGDVKLPMEALDNMTAGCFLQEDAVGVRSISLLHALTQVCLFVRFGTPAIVTKDGAEKAEAVPAPAWPDMIKDDMIAELIEKCSPTEGKDDVKVTVALLKACKGAIKESGVNPVNYLSKRGKTEFSVYDALRKEYIDAEKTFEQNCAAIDGMRLVDGLGNWPGLDEVMTKLKESAKRLEAGEDEKVEESDETLDATDEGNVDQAINDAEGAQEEGDDSAFGGAPDTGSLPVNQAVQRYVEGCESMTYYADDLLARIGEVELTEGDADVIQGALNRLAMLAMATVGKVALTSAFNAATKPAVAETPVDPSDAPEPALEGNDID